MKNTNKYSVCKIIDGKKMEMFGTPSKRYAQAIINRYPEKEYFLKENKKHQK